MKANLGNEFREALCDIGHGIHVGFSEGFFPILVGHLENPQKPPSLRHGASENAVGRTSKLLPTTSIDTRIRALHDERKPPIHDLDKQRIMLARTMAERVLRVGTDDVSHDELAAIDVVKLGHAEGAAHFIERQSDHEIRAFIGISQKVKIMHRFENIGDDLTALR